MKRTKLSKKRLRKPKKWLRNVRKSKQTRGHKYISKFTSKQVSSKLFHNSCSLSCRLKYSERFPDDCRENIFVDYYDKLNTEEQNQVLSGLMQVIPKEHTKNNASSRRTKTMKYYLIDQKSENQVCLTIFLNTFSISYKKVRINCKKKLNSSSGMVVSDQRGKHGQQRKVAEEALLEIKKHIESFPSYKSHYSRKDTDK